MWGTENVGVWREGGCVGVCLRDLIVERTDFTSADVMD